MLLERRELEMSIERRKAYKTMNVAKDSGEKRLAEHIWLTLI